MSLIVVLCCRFSFEEGYRCLEKNRSKMCCSCILINNHALSKRVAKYMIVFSQDLLYIF
jgi:hypothetical protein